MLLALSFLPPDVLALGQDGYQGIWLGATGCLPAPSCAWQPCLTQSAHLANAVLCKWLAFLHSLKQMFSSSLILSVVHKGEKIKANC